MVTVGLCCSEKGGLSDQLIGELMKEDGLIRYGRYDNKEDAMRGLEGGYVQAIWVFPEKLEEKLAEIAQNGRIIPVIEVIEREDDVSLMFSREVLCARIYPALARAVYEEFVTRNLEDEISKEELENFYQEIYLNKNLFEARYLDGAKEEGDNYLLSPIRGFLAIWLVVCGLAAVLFYQKDLQDGVYDVVPPRRRILFAAGLQGVALCNGGVIFLVAMKLLGVMGQPIREALCLVLFLCCVACFCLGLELVLGRMERVGVMIPILVILMIVACPVFFQIKNPYGILGILPPYYYLSSLHNHGMIWNMVRYTLIGACFCGGCTFLKNR